MCHLLQSLLVPPRPYLCITVTQRGTLSSIMSQAPCTRQREAGIWLTIAARAPAGKFKLWGKKEMERRWREGSNYSTGHEEHSTRIQMRRNQLEMETRSMARDTGKFSLEEATFHQFKATMSCQRKQTFLQSAATLISIVYGKLV